MNLLTEGARGNVVVTAICYKPEGRGIRDPMKWMFSIYLNLPAALGSGLYSVSNRNEYHKQKNVSEE
jgi:hypothetical protein